ncbi:5-oxoprolinase subunit C family protein [Sabulicella glaciei]|uniref:Biotin-dependent carboxyltransferase family protein n=1 Tax=Sabulicella glaciei TaxID=2984948 RepID=A0ABT3NYZ4_9PROT|nr:biotin-dependent carboxyltransferase family protein [Roseococcus sp. MDT2-1-1]
MIEILDTAPLSSVQDLGRAPYLRYGVSCSGVMDQLALRTGNALLGNAENLACIEIQAFPCRIRFRTARAFALTGADCAATLDGLPLPPWWAAPAREGAELTLSAPRRGSRAYLTVAGGIDVPSVLGSRSTQFRGSFGGHEGRWLQSGDLLPAGATADATVMAPGFGAEPPETAFPADWAHFDLQPNTTSVRVLPAGEYGLFTEESQRRFWDTAWKITGQSNRAGFRLAGQPLEFAQRIEMRSHGIVPGVVQVPPSGEPIIQLSDAHTAGGYPKIGTVIEADLWRLAQAPLGSRLRFVPVTYRAALDALRQGDAWIAALRRLAEQYRSLCSSGRAP